MTSSGESFSDLKARLCEAASAMCSGRATAEQLDWLEATVSDSAEAMSLYLDYMRVHAALLWRWQGHSMKLPPTAENAPEGELAGKTAKTSRVPVLGFLGDMIQAMDGLVSRAAKVALVTILLLGFCLFLISVGFKDGSHTSLMADDGRHLGVACLTAIADCAWNDETKKPELGDNLAPREALKLDEGTAEISMVGGTRLILEGPATFRTMSEASGFLLSGKLTVNAPRGASSFFLETPRFSVSKSDAEYGVVVGQDGGGTLEAFRGSVELQSDTPSDQACIRQVAAGDAVRINPNGEIVEQDAPCETRFVRQMPSPTKPQMIRGMRMWLKADAGVFQDVKGTIPAAPGDPVGCWIDQSGNGLSPRQDKPGWRPHLAIDNIHNLVIRFDGQREFLHEPSTTGPESRVLDPSDMGAKPQFAAFFVFRVPVSEADRKPQNMITKDRCCLFGQFTDATNDTSRYFYTAEDGRFCYYEWKPAYRWLRSPFGTGLLGAICIASVTRDGNQRAMYIDGVLVASDVVAEDYVGSEPSRWRIGARAKGDKSCSFFLGDIAEILIYNRDLSRRECLSVERYLREKYFGP